MIEKVLIANRGEIACRIIKTCQKMGIASVCIYSDADKDALHVRMADEKVHIGGAASSDSYLRIDRIVEACKQTGAQAVHPGYGFLSERPAFREALDEAGVLFVGPPIKAIQIMGDKIESKLFAENAGVNTVPGCPDLIESEQQALNVSKDLGFPVMIKASAGGGGKGMRIAYDESEVAEGFRAAKSEASSSFGDDRVFIEKFIEQPRHIEIQVLADKCGDVVFLAERECSIQRRNQKIIEEAPSSFLDEKTRQAMGAQSVALAKQVGYESAGTVEFIVDKDKNFYFLEMNTRLQVEHPVTECITGIDLVEQMIRIAAGEPLPFKQKDIKINGWSIESRIYAEDPMRNFLPSIGRLVRYAPPPEETQGAGITIRNDTGVYEGAEISMYYDPMITKLITHAPSREAAIDAMAEALDAFVIDGINHNISFLCALMAHPRWRSGDLSTNFISEEFPEGFGACEPDEEARILFSAIGAFIDHCVRARMSEIPTEHAFAPQKNADNVMIGFAQNDFVAVEILSHTSDEQGAVCLKLDFPQKQRVVEVVSDWTIGDPLWRGRIGSQDVIAQVRQKQNGYALSWRGIATFVRPLAPHIAALEHYMPEKKPPDTSKQLVSPMAGLLVALHVKEGDEVEAGQALCVMEAMKMENVLRAEKSAVIRCIHYAIGDSLPADAVIIDFE